MVTRLQETIQQNEKAFDSLSVSENRFKAVFDNANDSIIITDIDSRQIISVNEASSKMLGYLRDELLTMRIEQIHPVSIHAQVISAFEQMAVKPIGKTGALPVQRKDNSIFFSEINTSTFVESGKRMMIGLLRDITQQRTTERKLKEAKDSAEAASKAKSQFLANMSHEIRTPLNAVIGYSDLLGGILTDEKQKRHLESIKTAGRNLLSVINDILDLSKIEAGMMTITPESVNLEGILSDIEKLFTGQVEEKAIHFEVELDEGLPETIITDPARLRQILINLVGNAIKYTEKGFVHVKVSKSRVNEALSTLDLSIVIQDSGIGIPENDLDLIFEDFRQQDSQLSRRFEGTGLGLSISKKLTELLNGEIRVESTVGEGSCFEVLLHDVQASFQTMDWDAVNSDISHVKYRTGKVLIIDDELSSLFVLNEVLKKMGLISLTAISGKDGLNTARKVKPDLIIMDIFAPESDGLEIVSLLKEDPETSHIPLVAISASPDQIDTYPVPEHGVEELLSKPLNLTKLVGVLDKYLERLPESESNKNKSPSKFTITQVNKAQLSFLNQTIRKDYLPWSLRMKGVFKINEIKQFSAEIERLGKEAGCPQLVDCSSRLMKAVTVFDISAINKCLSDFQQLTESLNNLESNNG
jgi:PAS domain S-box-containing protein